MRVPTCEMLMSTSPHRHSALIFFCRHTCTLLPKKVADMLCHAISKAG